MSTGTGLEAGVGRRRITPPVGSLLMGYAPARSAESVNDDLNVTALALRSGSVKAMMVGADVCVIKSPRSEQLRRRVAAATGAPYENIVLAATHTHSGPAMRTTPGGAPADDAYLDAVFEPQLLEAAREAADSLQPARIGVGTTISDVGVNRREIDVNGAVVLGQNPWGCFDPVMTVVGFRSEEGKPIANLIHYGAHCTAAGRGSEITRDWAGPMVDRLEEESGAVTVFFNGAEGDSGPRLPNGKTTGDIRLAMELGGRAAVDAVRAYRTIRDFRKAEIGVVSDQIRLPYDPLPEAAVLERQLAEMGDPTRLTGLKVMAYETLLARLEESRSGRAGPTHLTLEQSVVSIGSLAFVPFPFEIFGEIALRVRKFSPYQHTLSLSNANGSHFYFVSQDQISRGGYEVWIFKSMNVHSLADDADDAVVKENLRLLRSLNGGEQ